jgi:hypothetical protein
MVEVREDSHPDNRETGGLKSRPADLRNYNKNGPFGQPERVFAQLLPAMRITTDGQQGRPRLGRVAETFREQAANHPVS